MILTLIILWALLTIVLCIRFLPTTHIELTVPILLLSVVIFCLSMYGISTTTLQETKFRTVLYSYDQQSENFIVGTYDDYSVFRDEKGTIVTFKTRLLKQGPLDECIMRTSVRTQPHGFLFDTSSTTKSVLLPKEYTSKRIIF